MMLMEKKIMVGKNNKTKREQKTFHTAQRNDIDNQFHNVIGVLHTPVLNKS